MPSISGGSASDEFIEEPPLMLDGKLIQARAISPKRPLVETAGLADVFPYYAGFSFDWAVAELRRSLRDSVYGWVLDPWNGSGTTTRAAQYLGVNSVGIDLNPVANVVAYLRCHRPDALNDLPELMLPTTAEVEDLAAALGNWFADSTARRIAQWAGSLRDCGNAAYCGLLQVSIFRVVRQLTQSFRGSNPTWTRRAKKVAEQVSVSSGDIDALIVGEYRWVLSRLVGDAHSRLGNVAVATASAARLPVPDSSIGATLTSPPYLTRIDYGIAYARELAVLGIDVWGDTELRLALMGTTLTRPVQSTPGDLGVVAQSLLIDVAAHESKASHSYYSKQAGQYVHDLCAGFDEITRVSKPGATLTLVVQDSYYKDVHVRLADMCIDEAVLRGWKLEDVRPFAVRRSLVTLNSNARAYSKKMVAESVIRLRVEN